MNLIKALWVALLLTGCATVPVPETVVTRPDSLPAAAELPAHWQLTGRISLTRGEEGWHGGVDWVERADGFRLRVSGPLGQGGFLLTGNADGVLLRDAAEQTWVAADADALLTRATGWVLPVTGLRYWVRGVPEPDVPFEARVDDTGRLAQLSQAGWTIRYTRYHGAPDGRWPARLGLVRDGIAVRLVIDRWQLGQPPVPRP